MFGLLSNHSRSLSKWVTWHPRISGLSFRVKNNHEISSFEISWTNEHETIPRTVLRPQKKNPSKKSRSLKLASVTTEYAASGEHLSATQKESIAWKHKRCSVIVRRARLLVNERRSHPNSAHQTWCSRSAVQPSLGIRCEESMCWNDKCRQLCASF